MDHDKIHDCDTKFDFSSLTLSTPKPLSSGVFFSKYWLGKEDVFIQFPRCGLNPITPNKFELIFTNDNDIFIHWVEMLTEFSQKFIFQNKEKWFQTEIPMELSDIESYFITPLKTKGKLYKWKVNILDSVSIYNEQQEKIVLADLKENTQAILIVELHGIKCMSSSFQIEIVVKQMLVLRPMFDRCMIKFPQKRKAEEKEDLISSSVVVAEEEMPDKVQKRDDFEEMPDFTLDEAEEIKDPSPEIVDAPLETVDTLPEIVVAPIEMVDIPSEMVVTLPEIVPPFETLPEEKEAIGEIVVEDVDSDEENEKIVALEGECKFVGIGEDEDGMEEIDICVEETEETEENVLTDKKSIYYQMYKEAKLKAKKARDEALASYLEQKRIKNVYALDNLSDDEEMF